MYKPKKKSFWKNLKPAPAAPGTSRDKIIERIRKLREMSAGRGASENEAATAARHFKALMDEHNITLSELELVRDAAGCVNDYYMATTQEREHWYSALNALGPLFHVKYWRSHDHHDVFDIGIEDEVTLHNFYGYPSDVEAAKSLAYIIHMGIIAEGAKFVALQGGRTAQRTAVLEKLPSFHAGIGDRLEKLITAMVETSASRALISLKGQLVNAEWAKFCAMHDLSFTYHGQGSPLDLGSYAAGQAAASNINLGRGSVSGGPLRIGGK